MTNAFLCCIFVDREREINNRRMKKYEYAGIDVSTEKSAADAATCYIEAVRRYMEAENIPDADTIAAILGLQRVEENKKEGEKKGE